MNYLAIFVASIIGMAVGMVWYSPAIFGKAWLKALGWSEKDLKQKKKGAKSMNVLMGTSFVCTLLTAYVLSTILNYWQTPSVMLGLQVGFWLWLSFTTAFALPTYLFEQRSLKLFAINAGHQLVVTLVMAVVLAIWM